MIDITIFFSAFLGAMTGIMFAKMIDLWVLKAEIKRKKEELHTMIEATTMLMELHDELEEKEKANENNKTRKTK